VCTGVEAVEVAVDVGVAVPEDVVVAGCGCASTEGNVAVMSVALAESSVDAVPPRSGDSR